MSSDPQVARPAWRVRQELRELIAAKLDVPNADELSQRVMSLFWRIDEKWEHLEATTFGDVDLQYISHRIITLETLPVEVKHTSKPREPRCGECGARVKHDAA